MKEVQQVRKKNLLPKPGERGLTEKQKMLLDLVAGECDGNALEAARLAGYADPKQAVRANKKHLVDLAQTMLAERAPKAVLRLEEILDSQGPVPGARDRIQASKLILDRTNPVRTEIDVTGEIKAGVVLLPAKSAPSEIIEGEYEEE